MEGSGVKKNCFLDQKNFFGSKNFFLDQKIFSLTRQLVGWLVGSRVSGWVGWLVGGLVRGGWVGWLVGWLVCSWVSGLVGWLVGWFVWAGLFGWLLGLWRFILGWGGGTLKKQI